jgi:hypothetical protein
VSKVQAYDFEIEYVKGKNNIVVDTLSNIPISFSMTKISAEWKYILFMEYSRNTITYELMEGSIHDDRYRVVDDIISYKYMIYLVPGSTLKGNILREVLLDTPTTLRGGGGGGGEQCRDIFPKNFLLHKTH